MATPEVGIINSWLSSVLNGDTGPDGIADRAIGGVHCSVAPQDNRYLLPPDADYPLVIFRYQSGTFVNGLGAQRVCLNAQYAVYAVARDSSYLDIEPIADRLDALLHGGSAELDGGRILSCVATMPLALPVEQDGQSYRALGAVYNIQAQRVTPLT